MANLFSMPSAAIGLMGRNPEQQRQFLALLSQQAQQPEMADALDEQMFAAAPNGYVESPQGMYFPADAGAQMQARQEMQSGPQAPAQRGRVSALNVLGRAFAPNITGALDQERARLQMEADRPQALAASQENERIARALGPQALLAFRSAPKELGESLGYQYRPTTTGAGGISSVFGTGQQVEAPRVLEFGNDLVQAGPLSGVRTLGTRGPSYAEQAQIGRIEQDAAQAQARLGLDYEKLGQDQAQFQERLGFDRSRQEARPLSAQQSRQLEGYLQEIETASSINNELGRFDQMLQSGELNLGPVANIQSQALNRLGISSPNSTNFAEFRSTLERLRNDSLRLNSGVQTEGDAQRAWNELISNINDENVVRRQIKRISDLNERAIKFKEGRVRALESGQYIGGGSGGGAAGAQTPPPPTGFVLD